MKIEPNEETDRAVVDRIVEKLGNPEGSHTRSYKRVAKTRAFQFGDPMPATIDYEDLAIFEWRLQCVNNADLRVGLLELLKEDWK